MARVIVSGRDAQGLLPAGERRRSPRLGRARAVLRGLAGLPRGPRPGLGRDLRRRRERVARRRRLAQRRPRRDVGALERGPGATADERAQALEDLGPDGGPRAAARRRRGRRRVREPRRRRAPGRCSARSTASPAATTGTSRRTSRPAISACRACSPHPDDAVALLGRRPGLRHLRDDRRRRLRWTPRNRGLRADWPLEDPEVGYCVHKLVMSPADHERLYQQNHCGMHRSDDAGQSWTEITEGLPSDFGFAAAAHPHDRDSFYVIPLDAGPRPLHAGRPRGGVAHARRRLELAAARPRPAAARRPPRRAARGHGDRRARRRRACTSAPAPARCSRAPTRARAGTRSPATCPAIASVEVAVLDCMADGPSPADAAAAVPRPAAPARGRGGDGRRGDRRARRALARPARPPLRARPDAAAAHQRLRRSRARRRSTPRSARLARRRDRRDQRGLSARVLARAPSSARTSPTRRARAPASPARRACPCARRPTGSAGRRPSASGTSRDRS